MSVPPRHPATGVTGWPRDAAKRRVLENEQSRKRAIYCIPVDSLGGYWAPVFLTAKKSGDSAFNSQSQASRRIYETVEISYVDLQVGYVGDFSGSQGCIPTNSDSPRTSALVEFQVGDTAYAFRCRPVGWFTAPLARVVMTIREHLSSKGVNFCRYLDDCLIFSRFHEESKWNTVLVVESVNRLCFFSSTTRSLPQHRLSNQHVLLSASISPRDVRALLRNVCRTRSPTLLV